MKDKFILLALAAVLALTTGSAIAGTLVTVTVYGQVDSNEITNPPLGNASSGDPATLSFVVDSDVFVDSVNFPTRGYEIDPFSFSLTFNGVTLGLQNPFPAGETPFFVIRDNDPAVDGFFVSTNVDFYSGFGVPLTQTGTFGQFKASFNVTYTGDPLSSLNILDAVGTYDFTGLTTFQWSVDDGPFQPLLVNFDHMTIVAAVDDDDNDGILNPDDLCADTVIPESVPAVRLGVNHWALADADGLFDTTLPQGKGPGFEFDLQDTAGCSCEQIIELMGLGRGHAKFGCSNSAMMDWSSYAAGAGYRTQVVSESATSAAEDRLANQK